MNTILVHIDDLMFKCGYYNGNTCINNGYGCNHPGCDDGSLIKVIKGDHYYIDHKRMRDEDVIAMLMTIRNIRCNRRLAKKFVKKARIILHERDTSKRNSLLKRYGFKWQGACYTFTCPLGYEADEQDFIEHGENPDSMSEGEWMVIEKKLYLNL